MASLSLRLQLTLLWSAVSLVVLLSLEALTLTVLSVQLSATVDRELNGSIAQAQQQMRGATSVEDLYGRAQAVIQSDSGVGRPTAIYLFTFNDGSRVTNTGDNALQTTLEDISPQPGQSVTVRDPTRGDLRIAIVPIELHGGEVGDMRIAVALGAVESTVGDLLTPLLVADACLILLGAALAYLVLGGGLAPVREITALAARISDGDLSQRIAYRGPRDEVGRLAETFDAMLGRLESGFAQRQAFYSLASHELRTPLTIVRGHLEVLRRVDRPSPDEVRETLDIALEELGRITDEVNDMLLLGRMLLGQRGELHEVDAAAVIRDVHRRANGLADRDWQLHLGGAAPVRADPEQLSRALLNLVTNAVRHTGDGDQVVLTCRTSHRWACLEVSDTGTGIPEDDLPYVFDPWYRGSTRDGNVGGLGLMIVREVARAHGGEVDVDSREHAGTTFTIRLPLAIASRHPRPRVLPELTA